TTSSRSATRCLAASSSRASCRRRPTRSSSRPTSSDRRGCRRGCLAPARRPRADRPARLGRVRVRRALLHRRAVRPPPPPRPAPRLGPTLPARWGWVLMELPCVVVFGALWLDNPDLASPVVMVLGVVWLVHYAQRTFVFPFLMRGAAGRRNAVFTVAMAIMFN